MTNEYYVSNDFYTNLADTYGVPRGAIRYNIFYFIDFIFIITLNILQFMDIIISLFALGFYNNYIKKLNIEIT
jgi:hypothetical protein